MMEGRITGGTSLAGAVPHVDRPALQQLFDAAGRRPICVVIGTAGWGKTTAVASWTRDRRASWIRCDDHDLDPVRFVSRLVRMLESQVPTPGAELRAVETSRAQGAVAMMRATCSWLHTALREELVLVIDDLQAVSPDNDLAPVVEALSRHVPERLHLVLVSRRELPFSLAGPRGRGLVAEINAPDLAFDAADVEVLLCGSIGVDPPDLAEQVWERTAGWPAAVLSAVELLRGIDPDGRPAALEHSGAGIADDPRPARARREHRPMPAALSRVLGRATAWLTPAVVTFRWAPGRDALVALRRPGARSRGARGRSRDSGLLCYLRVPGGWRNEGAAARSGDIPRRTPRAQVAAAGEVSSSLWWT